MYMGKNDKLGLPNWPSFNPNIRVVSVQDGSGVLFVRNRKVLIGKIVEDDLK